MGNIDVSQFVDNGFGVAQDATGYKVLPLGVKISASTVSTQGNIGIKFAISKTEVDSDISNATVTVVTKNGDGDKVGIFDLSNITPDVNGYYIIGVQVSAKQMTDNLTITLKNGEIAGKTYTYSVQQYAKSKLDSQDTTDELRAFIKAMLNYGAYM